MLVKSANKKILFFYILIFLSGDYFFAEKIHATSCIELTVRYYILCKDTHCYEGFQVNEIRTEKICGRRPVVNDLPPWVKKLASDLLKSADNVSSSGIFQIRMSRHYYEEEMYGRKAVPQNYEDFIERTVAKTGNCETLPDSIVRYKSDDMSTDRINAVFLSDISWLYQNYNERSIIEKISDSASETHIKSQKSMWMKNEIKSLNSLRFYKLKNRVSFFSALILIFISVSAYRKNITGNKAGQMINPKTSYPVLSHILLQMIFFIISIKLAYTSLFGEWLFIFIWPIIVIVWVYEFLLYVSFACKRKFNA